MFKKFVLVSLFVASNLSFGASVGNNAVPVSQLGKSCDYNGAMKLSTDGRAFGCVGGLWKDMLMVPQLVLCRHLT